MPPHDENRTAARADLCRFLAACYYQPGPEFAEEKVFDSMLDAATRIRPELAEHARHLGEAFSAEGHESLLVEYTRLFLGPNKAIASPYGSVWLSGESILMHDSTMAVLDIYHEGGFDIDEQFRELPDHIAAELEFLYLLIHRENHAHRAGEPESPASVAGLRKRFLNEHLGRWVSPFTTAVSSGTRSKFYRELAELTRRFVIMEVDNSFDPLTR